MAVVIRSEEMDWKQLKEGIQVRTVSSEFLTAQLVKIDKGTKTPLHTHVHEQLGFLLKGRVQFMHGEKGEILTVEPGMYFFFASNEPHGLVSVPEDTLLMDIFGPARNDYEPYAVNLIK